MLTVLRRRKDMIREYCTLQFDIQCIGILRCANIQGIELFLKSLTLTIKANQLKDELKLKT